jgi:hypothetical protein
MDRWRLLALDFPRNSELIRHQTEPCRPKCFLQLHSHSAAFSQIREDAFRTLNIVHAHGDTETLRPLILLGRRIGAK